MYGNFTEEMRCCYSYCYVVTIIIIFVRNDEYHYDNLNSKVRTGRTKLVTEKSSGGLIEQTQEFMERGTHLS